MMATEAVCCKADPQRKADGFAKGFDVLSVQNMVTLPRFSTSQTFLSRR